MGLIERSSISEQADTVARKLLDGQQVDQAEAVGLAQEIVRLSDQLAGAVEENERLREALAWYANGDHFPHPDYAARARSALRKRGGR